MLSQITNPLLVPSEHTPTEGDSTTYEVEPKQ